MNIRPARESELPRLMELFDTARAYMRRNGNTVQWVNGYPSEDLIRQDIAQGKSYVCLEAGRVVGTFFFTQGKDVEPTYRRIEAGAWRDDSPYGVVHRLASDGSVPGTGRFCLRWAYAQCGHLRIDTHGDNRVMQTLLEKEGFLPCGTIYVEEDPYPRIAYEKSQPQPAREPGA